MFGFFKKSKYNEEVRATPYIYGIYYKIHSKGVIGFFIFSLFGCGFNPCGCVWCGQTDLQGLGAMPFIPPIFPWPSDLRRYAGWTKHKLNRFSATVQKEIH